MMTYMQYIRQIIEGKFACLMLNTESKKLADYIAELHRKIDKRDVNEDGLETEPHITLLYGISLSENPEKMKQWIDKILSGGVSVKVGDLSLFENNEYDVLKLDVDKENLIAFRDSCMKEFSNTQTFPDYKPHITIAYLKKGKGKKYTSLEGFEKEIMLDCAIYSYYDLEGKRSDFKVNLNDK